MNSTLLLNSFRFVILLALQVVIFNNINFLGYINPLPYILFIILYPVNANRAGLLVASFLLGLVMDMFCNSVNRDKLRRIDRAVDSIRGKYGFDSVRRGAALADMQLGALNARDDHAVHPVGFAG